jgi:hypothetical protein
MDWTRQKTVPKRFFSATSIRKQHIFTYNDSAYQDPEQAEKYPVTEKPVMVAERGKTLL